MATSRKQRTVSVDSSLRRFEARHRALLAGLADIGLVLRGSITRRLTCCGNPACRCKADPPMLHGPYPIWTRKVAGKTVTAQLKPEYAALCQDWNRNMRTLDRTVRQLQAIGLRAATALRGR
ncbi:MAG: DUF6788 family protein [Burkholderiales bacterium]